VIEHALEAGDVEFAYCRDVAQKAREHQATERRVLTPVEVDEALYPE
jgi:hypothetical protein